MPYRESANDRCFEATVAVAGVDAKLTRARIASHEVEMQIAVDAKPRDDRLCRGAADRHDRIERPIASPKSKVELPVANHDCVD